MTDNEIINALGCCTSYDCEHCKYEPPILTPKASLACSDALMKTALDLINRYQAENEDLEIKLKHFAEFLAEAEQKNEELKAENERLEQENHLFADIGKMYSEVKAEAIKEFAERLKEYSEWYSYVTPRDIDNLVKKMVGDTDA